MGAEYPNEHIAIQEIKQLSPTALEWLHHHLGNAMTGVIGGIEIRDYDLVKKAAEHALQDLKKIRSNNMWSK